MDLNPVALTSAPLLRAIATPGWETQADLARHAGRDPRNMARDLSILRSAGLVDPDAIALTPLAVAQLEALDRAATPTEALHADLIPDPDQPRKDFTSDAALADLAELEESILLRKRILQPLAVRPHPEPGKFWITDGERRWRAVGNAIAAGEWLSDRPLPITIQDTDPLETRLSQLTANMVRADMTPLEECDAFADLVDNHGIRTADLAAMLGLTQKTVQNRLRLRALSPEARARMDLPDDHPDHLGYKAALASLIQPRAPMPGPGESGSSGLADRHSGEGRNDPVIPAQAGTPAFDTTLTELQALTLIEIADWIERARVPDLGTGHYAPIDTVPTDPLISGLLHRGLIGFRSHGPLHHVTLRFSAEGLTDWLTGLGFHTDRRQDVLAEARIRAGLSATACAQLTETARYATPWLNRGETRVCAVSSPSRSDGVDEDAPAARQGGARSPCEQTEGVSPAPDSPNGPGWINGAPYERLFDRHNPHRRAADFAPDLPWDEWLERPVADFLVMDRLETWALPPGVHGFPTAQIQIAPIVGGSGWVYAAGYSSGGIGHHEGLNRTSGRCEAFGDRETAIAAGVDLIRDSLGRANRNRLPSAIYNWTVQMLDPTARPAPLVGISALADPAPTDQPALLPPSLEEREAQYNLEQARAQAERDAAMVDRFADAMSDTLTIARDAPSMPLHDATEADGSNAGLEVIIRAAFASLVEGDAPAAGACLALLWQRGGSVGSRLALMRFGAVVTRPTATGEAATPQEGAEG